jgi:hypothetical protein
MFKRNAKANKSTQRACTMQDTAIVETTSLHGSLLPGRLMYTVRCTCGWHPGKDVAYEECTDAEHAWENEHYSRSAQSDSVI